MKLLLGIVLAVGSVTSAFASNHAWNGANDPAIMDAHYEYNLQQLPTSAMLVQKPWSETYWPSNYGSINYRWNSPSKAGFGTDSPSKEEILSMSRDDLAQLAPSEKYDIYMGNYDFPLKQEAKTISSTRAAWWAGICDGWSIAATQYAEPQPVDGMNPDGVVVPFGSSDMKALMSYAAAMHFDPNSLQVGLRCTGPFSAGCDRNDIDPGALHVVLANEIGLKKMAFIVERDPTKQIWNQPVYGYSFTYLGSVDTHTAGGGVQVHTVIYYTDELDEPQWAPVTETAQFQSGQLVMDYNLELDENGNIVGGSMIGGDHPDFVWKAGNRLTFKEIMYGVTNLYRPVPLGGMPDPAPVVPLIAAATPTPVPTATPAPAAMF